MAEGIMNGDESSKVIRNMQSNKKVLGSVCNGLQSLTEPEQIAKTIKQMFEKGILSAIDVKTLMEEKGFNKYLAIEVKDEDVKVVLKEDIEPEQEQGEQTTEYHKSPGFSMDGKELEIDDDLTL